MTQNPGNSQNICEMRSTTANVKLGAVQSVTIFSVSKNAEHMLIKKAAAAFLRKADSFVQGKDKGTPQRPEHRDTISATL